MTEKVKRPGRTQVHPETPSAACGMFHLTRADIDKIVSEKISETERYTEMKREAEQA
jgi:hypothetical protein